MINPFGRRQHLDTSAGPRLKPDLEGRLTARNLMADNGRIRLRALNTMSRREFTETLGSVVERSAHLVGRAWVARPYSSLNHVHVAIMDALEAATTGERLSVLQAHTDLGNWDVRLSKISRLEQAQAGLAKMTAEELVQLQSLNNKYRERYGFPFIICARLHSKRTILASFARRLRNSPEAEFEKALREVSKIARLRLSDLVAE